MSIARSATTSPPSGCRFRSAAAGLPFVSAGILVLLLAACANQQAARSGPGGRYYDSRLGVWASPKLVADGEPVPRGGGGYLVGRPYKIGGRVYYPTEQVSGYSAVGTASWYGDAFHGRRTANGEIFDKNSISAAHPTLPLPSYVRVTNLGNGRSMIVRVNDRGPYHGGRIMDVSQRVAEALAFRGAGTAHIRVDYVGRASLSGSDDEKLLATLKMDGAPAQMDGMSPGSQLAEAPEAPQAPRLARRVAETAPVAFAPGDDMPPASPLIRRSRAPLPPERPYEIDFRPAAQAPDPGTQAALAPREPAQPRRRPQVLPEMVQGFADPPPRPPYRPRQPLPAAIDTADE